MTTPLLTVRNLRAHYGAGSVLHGIDLTVDAAEMVVILGANGAGKTTTLRALSQMIATSGTVDIDGQEIVGADPADVVRLGVAHVPQGRGTFDDLSVEDNLRLGAYALADRARRDRVDDDLDRWFSTFPRLAERRSQLAGWLSGGEQPMLAIARALMSRPRLLLLDEPSLGLAPLVVRDAFDQLVQINETDGVAMLIVEQNARLALSVAARGYVLETGRIVTEGPASDLLGDDRVRQAYLGQG